MDDQSLRAQMDTFNQQQNQQTSPVGSPMKEQGVVVLQKGGEPVMASPEYVPPKETTGIIEVKNESIQVPPDLQQTGISVPPSSQPVSQVTTISNSLPLTDDQIGEGESQPITSGFRWLSEWCILQLSKMHMHLKKIRGHFVRVAD